MDHEPRLTLPERRPHLRANLSVLRVPARDSGLTLAASVLGPQPRDEGLYGGGQCFSLGLGACNEILPVPDPLSCVSPDNCPKLSEPLGSMDLLVTVPHSAAAMRLNEVTHL